VKRALALMALAGCGIGVQRDLASITPSQVVLEDMCGVQGYHDAVSMRAGRYPAVIYSSDLEKSAGKRAAGGITEFRFEEDFPLAHLRRILRENYQRLPEGLLTAPDVRLEVQWAEKASLRRVVTTQDARITWNGQTRYLPYHICLSELLFGGPLYKTRRDVVGLPTLLPELEPGRGPVLPYAVPSGSAPPPRLAPSLPDPDSPPPPSLPEAPRPPADAGARG
jgi:hypothetical protein